MPRFITCSQSTWTSTCPVMSAAYAVRGSPAAPNGRCAILPSAVREELTGRDEPAGGDRRPAGNGGTRLRRRVPVQVRQAVRVDSLVGELRRQSARAARRTAAEPARAVQGDVVRAEVAVAAVERV